MQFLGKSLQRLKKSSQRSQREKYRGLVDAERDAAIIHEEERQQQYQQKGAPLKSIWETSNLEEFLLIADAREKGYEAARDLRVVVDGTPHVVTSDKVMPMSNDRVDWLKLSELLTIPRRPKWDYGMSAAEIQALETLAFFEWRRCLSKMEEEHKVVMTPYEKNLEVWRQLWRVVERADVVLMILDARNPLVFRCADFEEYVRGTCSAAGRSKEIIFLLNKSDLLTESQRSAWATYFTERGEPFIFFSATPAAKATSATTGETDDDSATDHYNHNEEEGEEEEDEHVDDVEGTRVDDGITLKLPPHHNRKRRHNKKSLRAPVEVANPYELVDQRQAEKARRGHAKQNTCKVAPPTKNEKARDARVSQLQELLPWAILDPVQLLDRLALWRTTYGIKDANTPLMVGLVGYPNVGKSSTINAILGCKKVVVSATPGKTKHFQTLVIPDERRVALCDCPGLVFPSFASTREQMVCDGILPIDTATDVLSAVNVLCRRIPCQVLQKHFNVSLRPEEDVDNSHSLAERFLNAVARRRGYLGAHDRPNMSRAARDVLKLYVDGVILYAEPPPGYTAPHTDPAVVGAAAAADDGYGYEDETYSDAWEDVGGDSCDADGEDWDNLDSAADARALSEDGDAPRDIYAHKLADEGEEEEVNKAALPMFYSRPNRMRGVLTPQEAFNVEANMNRIKALTGLVPRRKKRTNHQLDPVTDTFVNNEGEMELVIDDDDGIIELVAGASPPIAHERQLHQQRQHVQKQRSKRQIRRELKRLGSGPVNPTSRKLGVQGY
ncbi:large subunit GTPase 1 [Trypanosoma rangeli]|uniref:Large subunit GTPase 1 n=1 Tax=Trypanosoma rangeli TaxID=5698 RepID=A0A422NYH3_TRYRA|nr:large subunit GTPase 1 [Trypanosoma rangeli]RNF10485.1 large subunit GTPase 1 [Trypanosoma rangeli]|eukprot:RNF10485.1 large subunit GTPase 1 [Trypanosoma rangeli]